MKYNTHLTLSIFRKVGQITFALILVAVLLWLSLSSRIDGKNLLQQHTTHMAEVLIVTTLESIKSQFDNKDELSELVNNIADNENISALVVYDSLGQIIAQSSQATPVIEHLQESELRITHYTKELKINDILVGYVRLTLETDEISNTTKAEQDKLLTQYRIMLLLCFIIGVLLTKGFSRFSEALSQA